MVALKKVEFLKLLHPILSGTWGCAVNPMAIHQEVAEVFHLKTTKNGYSTGWPGFPIHVLLLINHFLLWLQFPKVNTAQVQFHMSLYYHQCHAQWETPVICAIWWKRPRKNKTHKNCVTTTTITLQWYERLKHWAFMQFLVTVQFCTDKNMMLSTVQVRISRNVWLKKILIPADNQRKVW